MTCSYQRDPMDRYYSVPMHVEVITQHLRLHERSPQRILEPACGQGAISKVLASYGHTVTTADIDPGVEADHHGDSMARWWDRDAYDYVITNPPFGGKGHCARWVRHFRQVAPVCAMLLPLSFLEPARVGKYRRIDLLCEEPPAEVLVMPRVSFTGDGKTASMTCIWSVWRQAWQEDYTVMQVIRPEGE